MADTRRVMHVIEGSGADSELVNCLLVSSSGAEATSALILLRGSLDDRELLMLANLRSVLAELPSAPFRPGESLDVLSRAGGYEDTGRSYRRRFETTSAGVFGIEFVGRGHGCTEIAVHSPDARRSLRGPDGALDRHMLRLFVEHRILLDALLEAVGLLGWPMQPPIYVSLGDFIAENGSATTSRTTDDRS